MPIKISLLIPTRSNSDGIALFERCFNSIINKTDTLNNVELLVKLDNDDTRLEDYKNLIGKAKDKGLEVKYIINSRDNGYMSLHKFCMDLLLISAPNTLMYFTISDDAEFIYQGWDTLLINCAENFKSDMFVIHPSFVENFKDKNIHECLQGAEPYPIWSRNWLHTQGFFGHAPTDGWTAITEFTLYKKYGIDHRILTSERIIIRHADEQDNIGSERYYGARKDMMKANPGEKIYELLEANTDTLALKIISGNSFEGSIREKYIDNLKESMLFAYEQRVQYMDQLNRFKKMGRKNKFFYKLNKSLSKFQSSN